MDRYTGCKTSPYTEGALFYAEKLVDVRAQELIESQAARVAPPRRVECPPRASG